ncbi:MAG: hypothetical protein WAN34_06570 [Acidimicrobiia bacterium]
MSGETEQSQGAWNRPLPRELLNVAIAIAMVGLFSLADGGFLWMAGVIVGAEAIWLLVRYSRNHWAR